MRPSTNFHEAEADDKTTDLPVLRLPADTHPRLVAMVRRNFAALDPSITRPPQEALQ